MSSSKTNTDSASTIVSWLSGSYVYSTLKSFTSWRSGSWLLQWSEPIGVLLLSLVFCLAPFVSTSLIGVLLVAIAFYWLLVTLSEEGSLHLTSVHGLVFIYWLVATLAMLLSPVRPQAIAGWIKLTLYLGMFALAAGVLRSQKLTNWLITGFLLTALIVSGYGIRQQYLGVEQLATWNDPNSVLANDTRVYSYLGNPNLLGGYLLPAIAFSVIALLTWSSWTQKLLAAIMVGANSACLFFTDSRGAWLATMAMVAVLFFLLYWWWRDFLPRFWRIWLLPLVFGTAVGFLAVAIVGVESIRLRFLSIFAGSEDSSNSFRQFVWRTVDKIIKDYPLTGIGPGNEAFNAVYPRYMDPRYPALSAYSIYLEHIVEMGYIGFFTFLSLILTALRHAWLQINRLKITRDAKGLWAIGALAGMAGLLVHGVVDTVWYRPSVQTLWWLVLAVIASNSLKPNNSLTQGATD